MTSNLSRVEGSRVLLSPSLGFESPTLGTGRITEISEFEMNITTENELTRRQSGKSDQISIVLPSLGSFVVDIKQTESVSGETAIVKICDGQQQTMTDLLSIIRKNQHISICNQQDVEATDRYNGFSELSFVPHALPNLSWDELDTSVKFMGRSFSAPLFITGMTGGVLKGAEINRRLALAAEAFNIPMGVGSQRIALDNPDHAATFQVRRYAPDIFLVANIGLSQLISSTKNSLDLCKMAVDMIEANALAIHLNTMQELIQAEGQRDFKGILAQIEDISNSLNVPVLVKEVGSGVDLDTARLLVNAGIKTIDIAGRGGTSWPYIEGLRSENPSRYRLAQSFRNWGIPTAHALAAVKSNHPDLELIATGGMRGGTDVAKAVATGASLVGIGLPLMKAALIDDEQPKRILAEFVDGLKLCMMGTNSTKLDDLKKRIVFGQPYQDQLQKHIHNLTTPNQ